MDERQQKINDTRAMLDWLEANPIVDIGTLIDKYTLYYFIQKDKFIEAVRAFGTCEKEVTGSYFKVTKSFGSVRLVAEIPREEVCTKRTVTKEVEVEEWVCEPLLSEKEVEEITA